MPLSNAIETHARQRPEALAVSISGTAFTYADLHQRISGLSAALNDLPRRDRPEFALAETGRLFALTAGNHPNAALALTCAMSTPHAVAVLDPQWPDDLSIRTLLRLEPDALVCLSTQPALVAAARQIGIPVLHVDAPDFAAGPEPKQGTVWPDPASTFMVGFTSGTTSTPKAFARSRHSWRASLDAGRVAFALTEKSDTFAPGPLAHGITLYAMAETLDLGAAFHASQKFDSRESHHALASVRRVVAVPTFLNALSKWGAQPQISEITTAGAKLDPFLLNKAREAFPKARIHEYYGASELGFVSLNTHGRTSSAAPENSVGFPFPHVSLSIRDKGGEVAQGQTGTIFVRGDLAIDGYLWGGRNSGFRREGPWATVGDVGKLNYDGSLSILGREGGMVITSGHNVYPQEIETALAEIPGIRTAVVLGLSHPSRGDEIIAILEGDPPLEEIRAQLAIRLPRYKLPRRFYTIGDWPLTSSGKIARGTLSEWLREKDERLVPFAA